MNRLSLLFQMTEFYVVFHVNREVKQRAKETVRTFEWPTCNYTYLIQYSLIFCIDFDPVWTSWINFLDPSFTSFFSSSSTFHSFVFFSSLCKTSNLFYFFSKVWLSIISFFYCRFYCVCLTYFINSLTVTRITIEMFKYFLQSVFMNPE